LNVGGPARHVVWLTSRADPGRWAVTLGTGHVEANEAEMTDFIRAEGVTPVYLEGLGRSIGPRDLPAFLRVLRLMHRIEPDIVDTHTAKAGLLGRLAAFILNLRPWKKKRIRTVHTFHGHVFHGYFSPLVSRIFLLIERFLGRFATDRIVVISRQQFEELAFRYRVAPPGRFRIVPLGIDLDRFKPVPRDLAEAREIRVGLVGRLTAIKNPDLFLEAGFMARGQEPRIKLVVIGDGELRRDLQEKAQGLVEFLGNRDDIETLMPTLDILVISSENEGTPMSVIEAFASGVGVVGTRAGGVVDLLADDRGLLSDRGDATALSAHILRVIREPELAAAMRERALAYVRKEYPLARLMAEMERLYEEIISPAS
jgi:glycosyltransferase involved in cell wall biosynthesis